MFNNVNVFTQKSKSKKILKILIFTLGFSVIGNFTNISYYTHSAKNQPDISFNLRINKVYAADSETPVNNVIKKIVVNKMPGPSVFFIKNNGEVLATGFNNCGQLGVGDTKTRVNILEKLSINNIKDIAAGGQDNTIFLKNDGTVWATGRNVSGELGLGDKITRTTPTQVNINSVQAVACGTNATYFIKNDGTVWAAGSNSSGQLGVGDTKDRLFPSKTNINNVKKIVAGDGFVYFMKNDGTIWAAGFNGYGQLGTGNRSNQISPFQINISDVKDVYCGHTYVIFLKNNGTVYAAGDNGIFQLGLDNTNTAFKTIPTLLNIQCVSKVSPGSSHSVFLINDGSVFGCGANDVGQLGMGKTYNIPFKAPTELTINNVKDIIASYSGTIFIKNDGTIWATGNNALLCNGSTSYVTTPVQVYTNIN